jgi:hypothetical protein
MQIRGEARIYIWWWIGVSHILPDGWAMVFIARMTIIQKQVCQETSVSVLPFGVDEFGSGMRSVSLLVSYDK